ncbi:hypothetical protein KDC22_18445 [Paenibacillus tritici]|uniref:hypothetical protein n=1 Tax=Paenibacillus tritici TaxID=1873425 RepID=UPI001BAA2295|nr:hypothetical protein [Paenibacillus tritici]QUL52436.1 hypothetical protein KDC22_18445 [Paenibacillus tritici]
MRNEGPEQVLEVQRVLEQIVAKQIPVHVGCQLLTAMLHNGNEWVWSDFDEYYSLLADIPLPDQYLMWNQEALLVKLKKLDLYEEQVIHLAKRLYDELKSQE